VRPLEVQVFQKIRPKQTRCSPSHHSVLHLAHCASANTDSQLQGLALTFPSNSGLYNKAARLAMNLGYHLHVQVQQAELQWRLELLHSTHLCSLTLSEAVESHFVHLEYRSGRLV
jgi:hypothetical protein